MPRTPTPYFRRLRTGLAIAALAALLAGCVGAPPGTVSYSQSTYNRTFDAALGALADQKLVISEQDRRGGRIVAKEEGITLTATLEPLPDGSIRVSFRQQPEGEHPDLLKRVTQAYEARVSQRSVLGGFKDSGDSGGPIPCANGPAFCK